MCLLHHRIQQVCRHLPNAGRGRKVTAWHNCNVPNKQETGWQTWQQVWTLTWPFFCFLWKILFDEPSSGEESFSFAPSSNWFALVLAPSRDFWADTLCLNLAVCVAFGTTKDNRAKTFAKQLASGVHQNKAHFKCQVCYDKVIPAIASHRIVVTFGCIHPKLFQVLDFLSQSYTRYYYPQNLLWPLSASSQNYFKSRVCYEKDIFAIVFHNIVVPSGCIHPKLF